jgi:hypothetical protein
LAKLILMMMMTERRSCFGDYEIKISGFNCDATRRNQHRRETQIIY